MSRQAPTVGRRRRGLRAAALAGGLVAGAAAGAEPPWPDPWHPSTVAAAEAAVQRLGPRPSLQIQGSVLAIPGLTAGLGGSGTGIVASVRELAQAMRDLGAEESALEVRIELPADVLFDFDKADIRADAADALAKLATVIAAHPGGRVELHGHTDSRGDDGYNQRLSERRAEAVRRWLVERHAVDGGRVSVEGLGESRPIADNATDAGRQRNRRVDAIIHKQR